MSVTRRWSIIAVAALIAVSTYYFLPATLPGTHGPVPIPEAGRRAICIFLMAVIFWSTEVIPLYATSLCLIGMQVLFIAGKGGMGGKFPPVADAAFDPAQLPPATAFFDPFSSGVILLFMGGFLLSAAITKHRLDRKIAARLLKPFAARPSTLLLAVLLISAFFSMWMSNTATAVMMLAIVAPIVKALPEDDRFHRGVILAVPFGANIGGIGTPIGTPPNAIALAALRERFPDLTLSFLDWMLMAVPLAVLLLAVAWVVLFLTFRPKNNLAMPAIDPGNEPISAKGWTTLIILGITITLWICSGLEIELGSFSLNLKQHLGLSTAAIALLAAAALTAFNVLDKRDVDNIDWNVLILMWGGMSLGVGLQTTGVVDVIAQLPIVQFNGLALATVLVLLSVTLGTFMSHTAASNVLVPLAVAVGLGGVATFNSDGTGAGLAIQLAVLTALASSFAMAMPVSTPPNAVAFATGKLTAGVMIRSGGILSIACVLTLLAGYQYVMPIFLKLVIGE